MDENSSSQGSTISQLAKDYENLAVSSQRSMDQMSSYENGMILKQLSNHFAIGNQNAAANGALETFSNKTSNNKLDQSLRISYAEMCERLKTFKPALSSQISKLNESYELYFEQWFDLMSVNFNILLHGVGSKKELIENFCKQYLDDSFYLVIFGYHHDFNIKTVLRTILIDMLNLDEKYKTLEEQINAINSNLSLKLFHF